MPAAIGSQTVFGMSAFEATFGTATTVDRFYEITGESITRENRVLQSQGLRGGYLPRGGGRRVHTGHGAAGDVMFEVASKGFSRVFQWILGGTPTIAQQGATTAYLHTHTMGSLVGRSATLQKQLRDAAGTEIESFTYHGSKANTAEFSIATDGILNLSVGVDARQEVTNVAAAASSYLTTNLFHFQQASLTVAGSSVADVSDATIRVNNNLNTDRRFLGNSGLKSEQYDNGYRAIDGSFTAEFAATTLYDLFAADTAAQLVLSFVSSVDAGTGYPERVTITVPEVHLTGNTPTVGGAELVTVDMPFEGAYNGTDSPIRIEYVTTDTAA